jgi:death-on-curing protein
MPPTFLTFGEVLEIHRDQIGRYGGAAGIRDLGLLQSALAQPRVTFGGALLHGDLAEMAAAYLFHLVCDHPFIDGNKRVALVSAIVFLRLNKKNLDVTEDKLEALVTSVAQGKMTKARIANFFRSRLT